MRTISDLRRLYDYNYWANQKLFAVLSQLTPDQFTQHVSGSYGSIRNALVHTMSAEWGWLDRCGGQARGPKLNPDDYPTVQSVVVTWDTVQHYVRTFLATLEDADLERDIEFAIGGGPTYVAPLGDLMHHSAIHAAHHRGQVALMLRELGYAPGNFDFLFFSTEQRAASAP